AAQRARALRDSIALADAQRRARARDGASESVVGSRRAVLLAPVYFDYDQSELRDDTRAALEAKLAILTQYRTLRVRVSGHTDDRGADEYNLALGGRRAAAVKRFFAERGVDPDRVDVVSFGKERPTCETEDDACWGRNRRAEFAVVRGGEALGGAP
ncbi:MAG TPA: OmpA family protein, partial [Gemmatirosa sp.]